MYMQRTKSGAAGSSLRTTIKYMRGAGGIGMGTTAKHLRCTTSGAAENGLGATMKYLRRTTSAAANNGLSTTIIPPCSAASFEINLEPHTGARPSALLCVGPELARCVHSLVYTPHLQRKEAGVLPIGANGARGLLSYAASELPCAAKRSGADPSNIPAGLRACVLRLGGFTRLLSG
jgi:hypothetical protein